MNDVTFDLDAYLARIGFDGPRAPTLDTLRALHRLHPQAIPFENLDPLLRRPTSLDPAALGDKLVRRRRGGWCFEHNGLLLHALTALGFRAGGLAARVLWNLPEGRTTARTHMLIRVELDEGTHLADVGFGGMVLTAPLRLEPGVEQATPHGVFRLTRDGGDLVAEARLPAGWKPLYRFDLAPQQRVDHELASWYLETHPASHFLSTLIASRVDGPLRLGLRNHELAVHHPDGTTQRHTLSTPAELRAVLEERIGLALPGGPELDALLARFTPPAG